MGSFNRGNGNRDRNRSFGNNRSWEKPSMHKAICSKCGKECEVPFRPTGEKPVYCRDCFREMGGGRDARPSDRNFPRPDGGENKNTEYTQLKTQFAELNIKLDKILHILESAISTEAKPEAEVATPEKEEIVVEKKKRSTKKAL